MVHCVLFSCGVRRQYLKFSGNLADGDEHLEHILRLFSRCLGYKGNNLIIPEHVYVISLGSLEMIINP